MNAQNGRITKRESATWKTRMLALGLIAGVLILAWTIWDPSASQPELEAQRDAIIHPSFNSSAEARSDPAGNSGSVPQPLPGPTSAAVSSAKPELTRASVAQHQPSSPEIDLGAQARLALQSGTAEEAEKAAFSITYCESIDTQLHNLDSAPLKDSSVKHSVMNLVMGDQRRCQALDAAAKALYEPLMLKAVEGGSRSAARSISTRSELLAKLTPEQRLRVAQTVKEEAARGDWISIFILSNASARLGTSLQDDYAYSIALQSIRQVEGKNMSYFKLQSREQIELWDAQLEFKAQQLSPAEVEQSRQQAEAVLRSYREARLKNQNHNPQQP